MKARAHPPAVLVLGELAERHEQLRLLRAIRTTAPEASEIDPWLGVIVLGSECGELAQLRAFEAGCDDYVTADVSYPLLRARLAALLARLRRVRRAAPGGPSPGRPQLTHGQQRRQAAAAD